MPIHFHLVFSVISGPRFGMNYRPPPYRRVPSLQVSSGSSKSNGFVYECVFKLGVGFDSAVGLLVVYDLGCYAYGI